MIPNATSRWQQAVMSVERSYAESPGVLRCGDVVVGSIGNFSVSLGKAKSKKSFHASALAAAALCSHRVLNYEVSLPSDKQRVLYIDTEQSKVDCQKVMRRILKLAGLPEAYDSPKLLFLALREYSPEERISLIEETLEDVKNIGFVVLDGVRDLLHDINGSSESTAVVSHLMKWTDRGQFHLHTVLHQNKSDDNARGHIGTELDNKAETVMIVERDRDNTDASIVKPVLTRAETFQAFAFQINSDALPELVEDFRQREPKVGRPQKEEFNPAVDILHNVHLDVIRELFPRSDYAYPSYNDYQARVCEIFKERLGKFNSAKANKVIRYYLEKGVTIQNSSKKHMLNPDYSFATSEECAEDSTQSRNGLPEDECTDVGDSHEHKATNDSTSRSRSESIIPVIPHLTSEPLIFEARSDDDLPFPMPDPDEECPF